MPVITKSILIKALPERVFAVIADPYLVLPLMPGLRSISNVSLPLAVGSTFDWEYQLLGLTFHGKWVVEQHRPPHFHSARSEGGIASRWEYTLIPRDGMTHITLDIRYDPPDSLIKGYALQFIEPHTKKLADAYLHSLKNFLEKSPSLS